MEPRTVSVSLCRWAQDPAARRPGSLGAFGEWIRRKKGPRSQVSVQVCRLSWAQKWELSVRRYLCLRCCRRCCITGKGFASSRALEHPGCRTTAPSARSVWDLRRVAAPVHRQGQRQPRPHGHKSQRLLGQQGWPPAPTMRPLFGPSPSSDWPQCG